MSCPAIQTGQGFLAETLLHIDCQAQTLGSYGFGALADPQSAVFIALTGALTIFIALFGFRLMLGGPMGGKEIIDDVIKLGIVLTIATSWPAWRIIGYDTVLKAPAELANTVGAVSGLSDRDNPGLIGRLQRADDNIVLLTVYGTGRLTGGVAASKDLADDFQGIALGDQFGLGIGRTAFLVGTIAPYAITRIGAGILLALAPLMAGLLLFFELRAIFLGWVRGLFFCALGNLGLLLVQGINLAMFEPWMSSAINLRQTATYAPAAPTELLVFALSFCVLSLGVLFLTGRIVFHASSSSNTLFQKIWPQARSSEKSSIIPRSEDADRLSSSRAYAIAQSVETRLRWEEQGASGGSLRGGRAFIGTQSTLQAGTATRTETTGELLGSSHRRNTRRNSAASNRRDRSS